MKYFEISTKDFGHDIAVLREYIESTLELYWEDDVRTGYESILSALTDYELDNHGNFVLRFQLVESAYYEILHNILTDAFALCPYIRDDEYYMRQVDSILFIASEMTSTSKG